MASVRQQPVDKSTVEQPVPDMRSRFVIAEAQRFDVVPFSKRQVDKYLMIYRLVFAGIRHAVPNLTR
jgi:hypothetical protein